MKEYEVFVDHETIVYKVMADSKEEAEEKALWLNGKRREVEVSNVEAWELEDEKDKKYGVNR